jgi:hypothetical protein
VVAVAAVDDADVPVLELVTQTATTAPRTIVVTISTAILRQTGAGTACLGTSQT